MREYMYEEQEGEREKNAVEVERNREKSIKHF